VVVHKFCAMNDNNDAQHANSVLDFEVGVTKLVVIGLHGGFEHRRLMSDLLRALKTKKNRKFKQKET